MLYFTSGIQKDGIVFTTLGFLAYAVFQSLQQNVFSKRRVFVIILAFAVLFLIRSYVLINVLPALIIWVLVKKFNWPPLRSFITGYIILGLLFFNINSVFKAVNPPATVAQKQADFFTLPKAVSQLETDTLYPTFKSFLYNAPQAYNHLLLRPYIYELPTKSMLPVIIETLIYQLLFVLFIFFRRKEERNQYNPFILFGIFFTLTMLLFIGYIMPNLGSLVRYRSVYLCFLITPVVCNINWERLRSFFKIKK
jgi:hypothetical protein